MIGLYVVLQSMIWFFISIILFHCVLLDYIEFIKNKISYGKKLSYYEAKLYNIFNKDIVNDLNTTILPLKNISSN